MRFRNSGAVTENPVLRLRRIRSYPSAPSSKSARQTSLALFSSLIVSTLFKVLPDITKIQPLQFFLCRDTLIVPAS